MHLMLLLNVKTIRLVLKLHETEWTWICLKCTRLSMAHTRLFQSFMYVCALFFLNVFCMCVCNFCNYNVNELCHIICTYFSKARIMLTKQKKKLIKRYVFINVYDIDRHEGLSRKIRNRNFFKWNTFKNKTKNDKC